MRERATRRHFEEHNVDFFLFVVEEKGNRIFIIKKGNDKLNFGNNNRSAIYLKQLRFIYAYHSFLTLLPHH